MVGVCEQAERVQRPGHLKIALTRRRAKDASSPRAKDASSPRAKDAS